MEKNISHLPHKASPVLVKQANIFADLPAKLIEDFQQEFQLNEWHKGDYFNLKRCASGCGTIQNLINNLCLI